MKEVRIDIKAIEREIEIEIPLELRKKISEEEFDEINSKVFGIASILNDIAKR